MLRDLLKSLEDIWQRKYGRKTQMVMGNGAQAQHTWSDRLSHVKTRNSHGVAVERVAVESC